MAMNPPPAPPPLPIKRVDRTNLLERYDKNEQTKICLWASKFPELQWTCGIWKLNTEVPPAKCTYRKFAPQRQEGPTCGLVALSILLGNNVTAQDLLAQSRSKNYTVNGEMFSVINLLKLLKDNVHHGNFDTPNIILRVGILETDVVINFLLSGGVMLVPYDAWVNHAPYEAKGHKAHWALICGIIISEEDEYIQVLAWHGKSQRLAMWRLKDLSLSNANLQELNPEREKDEHEYCLPPGGITGTMGLQGRSILIDGFKDDAFKIGS